MIKSVNDQSSTNSATTIRDSVVSTWYLLPCSLLFTMILSSIVCLNQSTVNVLHIPIASQPMIADPPSIMLQVELAGTLS